MKALVVFGSKSDEKVYGRIISGLKKNKIQCELRICSAHKTPEELDDVLDSNFDFIIAGAGLAAHLPGVIASKTIKPVIGVPCEVDYQGLDALLSIVQMPPGIPVIGVGINAAKVVVEEANKFLDKYEGINLVGDENNKVLKKAAEILKDFKVEYEINDSINDSAINIEFTGIINEIDKKAALVIYCPVGENNADIALSLLKHSSHGLWVGMNNGTNAALAAVQLLNFNGRFNDSLTKYRRKIREKVREHDREVKKR